MADPDTFRVSPSLQNLPGVSAPPVENAGPGMIVRAGQTLQRMGAAGSQIYQDVMREQNATRVTEALREATEYQYTLTYGSEDMDGWTTQQGKNALERGDDRSLDEEFGSLFENRIGNLELELGNDAQRKMFRERAEAMSLDLRGRIQSHVAEQGFKYRQDTLTGVIESGQRLMGTATDPLDMARAADMARQAASQLADMRGLPDEQRKDFYRDALTPGHLGALARMQADEDVEGAELYFNAHRDELTYEATVKIETALLEQRAIMEGGEIGEQIAGLASNANSAAAPQGIGMPIMGGFSVSRNGAFGVNRGDHRHGGVDMPMTVGTPVYAGASGVARVKREPGGYGLYVDLKLDNGTVLRMAHLDGVDVEDGQRVEKGQPIARSGNSGKSTGPHLHYEVIGADGSKRDPIAFHQGGPQTPSTGTSMTLQDQLQQLYALDLPPRQEAEAERKIRSIHGARRDAENEERDNILSRAFTEIDSTGSMSSGTRSAVVAAGLGSSIPTLRGFEAATQDRRNGGTVGDDDGLIAYGNARQMIAQGRISSVEDLLPLKPYLTDSHYKQLVDAVTKSPQVARQEADQIITMMNEEIAGTGLFVDEDGKQTTETKRQYARFVGAVTRQIEVEQERGPVTLDRQREIVLGMVGRTAINSLGVEVAGYRVREYYDRIPAATRARIIRSLQREGNPRPTQSTVVSTWLRMNGQGR